MKSNLRIGILSAVLLVLFAPKAVDAKILSGNGTNAGGTGGSCATYGAGTYAWDSSHLAWYEFKYVDGISDDTTATVYSSTGLGPGGSITIEKDGESCAKYSDTFYLAGYVPYICGTGAMSGSQNWERVNHGTYYYTAGQPIGFPAGGGSFIITDSDSGLPSDGYPAYSGSTVVAWGKTVKESVALKAWQDLDPSNAGATQVPDSWFCGGEKEKPKQEGYFTGSAKIQIKENGKVVKENGSTTSSPTYTIYGTGKKTINFTASGAVAADTSKNNTLASNIVRYTTPPNWTLSTKGYSDNKAAATASKDSNLEMNPGDKMTVCAKNTYHSHYKSETGGWTNEVSSVETCIEINYVAATYSMGTASQIVVLQNGVRKANAFDIDQNSKNTSTGDRYGNGTSTTGSINSSFGQPSSVTVSSGIKPGSIEVFALNKVTKISKSPAAAADADIKLTGLTVQNPSNNSNACNNATLGSTIYYKDCYNAGDTTKVIYPEQTVTYTATTSVSSTISASGKASSDRVPTSASVTVTADPLTCPDFNNAQIGVNHPTNYGRIAINNATGENATNSAGNLPDGGWNNKVEKYYAPYGAPGNTSSSLQLSYYACMGYQSYLDANGISNNDVTYTVSSNREDVYARTNIYKPANMIDMRRVAGKNISAQEIGSNGLARINKKYSSGKQSTRRFDLDENFVGYTTSNTFAWNNSSFGDSRTVSIDLNVPYNYYLDDDTAPDIDEKVVFAGQSPEFKLNTAVKERINKKVEETSGYGNKYATKQLRTTKRTITPVYIDSSISASEIASKSKIIVPVDATNFAYGVLVANGLTVTKGAFSDGEELKSDTFNDSDNINILNKKVTFEPVEEGHIGDKLCIAVAIYPADSHNAIKEIDGKVTPLINDDQSSALNGPDYKNGGEKTLISLSCATVGKKPSMSVEGGSLMTKGAIVANNTTYGGHIFGSWAEYDIVSGYSTKGIIGSGAAFAYANPQTTINASRTDGDGLEDGKLKKPQSIGNTALNDYYGDNTEAAAQVARGEGMTSSAWQFANNIYQKYIADSSASHPDLIKSVAPDGASVNGIFTGAVQEGKLYMVYSTGKLRIDSNIENHLNNTIYVIYSEAGIDVDPSVTRIDAFLIANKNGTASSSTSGVATIDTCAGYDRDDSHGNQVLLENCNKTLVINGAVAAEKIVLDRVAGGGSYEDSEELKPESLTQRAEIFNYDMRVVFWATKMLDNEDVTNSTYVKELSPRL